MTQYVFKQDFWGNWKLVPVRPNSGGGFILAIIIIAILVIILFAAILTLPLWIALLGFKMVQEKKHYASIGSFLSFIYFLFDIKKRWISGFLFFGYSGENGTFNKGLFNEKYLIYFYIANGIGLLISIYHIYQAYIAIKNGVNSFPSSNISNSANLSSGANNNFGTNQSFHNNQTNVKQISKPQTEQQFTSKIVLTILLLTFSFIIYYYVSSR